MQDDVSVGVQNAIGCSVVPIGHRAPPSLKHGAGLQGDFSLVVKLLPFPHFLQDLLTSTDLSDRHGWNPPLYHIETGRGRGDTAGLGQGH
jgi:hypothetical protein